jgi:DNA-binding PadR family transcriptional regulator
MTGVLARWANRRDVARQRRVLAVMLLREVLQLGPTSGYPIGVASGDWAMAYAALARLEREGHVDSEWEPAPEGRPRRRLYRLTDTGRMHAGVLVSRWLRVEEGR